MKKTAKNIKVSQRKQRIDIQGNMKNPFWIFLIIGIITLSGSGCKKPDNFDTNPSASLTFSTNLVEFDTVFTTIGSSTHNFTVHNPNRQAVKVSDIRLQ